MLCPIHPEMRVGTVFKENFLPLLSDGADVLLGRSAEQESSVSRLLLVLLSAGSPFTSTAYQTDTESGTNWHGLWQLSDVPVKLLMTRLTPSSIQTVSRSGNSVKIHSSCACRVAVCVLPPTFPILFPLPSHTQIPRTYTNTMPIAAQMGAVWREMTHGPNDLFL